MFDLAYVPKCGTSVLLEHFDCFNRTTDFVPDNTVLLLRDPFDRAITEQIQKLDTADDFDDAYPDVVFEELIFSERNAMSRHLRLDKILNIDLDNNLITDEKTKRTLFEYLQTFFLIGLFASYDWIDDRITYSDEFNIIQCIKTFCEEDGQLEIPVIELNDKIDYINLDLGLRGKFTSYNRIDYLLFSVIKNVLRYNKKNKPRFTYD